MQPETFKIETMVVAPLRVTLLVTKNLKNIDTTTIILASMQADILNPNYFLLCNIMLHTKVS